MLDYNTYPYLLYRSSTYLPLPSTRSRILPYTPPLLSSLTAIHDFPNVVNKTVPPITDGAVTEMANTSTGESCVE